MGANFPGADNSIPGWGGYEVIGGNGMHDWGDDLCQAAGLPVKNKVEEIPFELDPNRRPHIEKTLAAKNG